MLLYIYTLIDGSNFILSGQRNCDDVKDGLGCQKFLKTKHRKFKRNEMKLTWIKQPHVFQVNAG